MAAQQIRASANGRTPKGAAAKEGACLSAHRTLRKELTQVLRRRNIDEYLYCINILII